jgi:endonuclease-3
VPDSIEELLRLPGVGRKTANLVATMGYGLPGICVDTHVHRITNRWGYVKTKTPDETETALRAKLPKKYWIEINDLLVTFGQNQCRPISPICSTCPVAKFCDRVGVTVSR